VEFFLPDLTAWHQELQKSAEASPPDSRSARKRQKTRCKTIQSAGFKVGYHGGLWKTWKAYENITRPSQCNLITGLILETKTSGRLEVECKGFGWKPSNNFHCFLFLCNDWLAVQ